MSTSEAFSKVANFVSHAAGKPTTFALCCLTIVVWSACGPAFGYSDTWQLIINTGTTSVTFLVVFLIQNTQNRDAAAIQAELDELIRTSAAQNAFIGIEHLIEEELAETRTTCEQRGMAEAAADAAEKRNQKGERGCAPGHLKKRRSLRNTIATSVRERTCDCRPELNHEAGPSVAACSGFSLARSARVSRHAADRDDGGGAFAR